MHRKSVCSRSIYIRYTGRLYLIVRPCTVMTTEISTALVASEQHSTRSQPVNEHQCYSTSQLLYVVVCVWPQSS